MLVRFWQARPRVALVTLMVILVLASARTWTRNPTWKDNDSMLNALVADYPYSGRSQWILGDALMDSGLTSDALRSYRVAVDLLDSHYQIMTDVAQTFINKEMYRAAEGLLWHAWRRDPRFALAPGLLAEIYSIRGELDQAERLSRVALTIDDRDPLRPNILAWSLASRGRFEEAEQVRQANIERYGLQNFWQQWVTLGYFERPRWRLVRRADGVRRSARRGPLDGRARASRFAVRPGARAGGRRGDRLPPVLSHASPVLQTAW